MMDKLVVKLDEEIEELEREKQIIYRDLREESLSFRLEEYNLTLEDLPEGVVNLAVGYGFKIEDDCLHAYLGIAHAHSVAYKLIKK